MIGSPVEWAGRALYGPVLIAATALLVKGYAEGGGGFPAGVVASLGVLLRAMTLDVDDRRVDRWRRIADRLAFAGLALAAAVAFAPLAFGEPPLSHWPPPGAAVPRFGVVEIHTSLLFETGIAMVTYGFVVGAVLGVLVRVGERTR